VQLIEAKTGAHLWADRFDTDRANLAEAQDEITGRLARTLNLELVETLGRRIEQEKGADPDARDLMMRSFAVYNRPYSAASREEARRLFERALELDPRSVDARIGLARTLAANLTDGWSSAPQQDAARAEQLLLEALERDGNRSMAHEAMGVLRRVQDRLAESVIELETAIALDPNAARAFHHLGLTLTFLGQPEAGIPKIEKAIRLNPHDPNAGHMYYVLGMCHFLLGHVEQAIDLYTKARAKNPRSWFIHLSLAGALGFRGDLDDAKPALAEAIKLRPELNSLARLRASRSWTSNPQYAALAEKTLHAGLRRAGLPDE
jgi:tetratricopeptide (TPR) repeat protein